MAEKTIKICDNCKKQVATSECAICGNWDLCQRCGNRIYLMSSLNTVSDWSNSERFAICKPCRERWLKLDDENKKSILDIAGKAAISALRKVLITESLKDE